MWITPHFTPKNPFISRDCALWTTYKNAVDKYVYRKLISGITRWTPLLLKCINIQRRRIKIQNKKLSTKIIHNVDNFINSLWKRLLFFLDCGTIGLL